MIKIGDKVDISNGYAFKSSKYVEQGIRVVRITNVQKGEIQDDNPKFYSSDTKEELKSYLINEGDILMSLTGNVGRVGVFPKEFCPAYLNQRVARIRVKSQDLFQKYLFYMLNSEFFERDAIFNSSGIAQLNLSTKWVSEYKIPLPPLEQQKKIAAILDEADAYRQKTKALIEKYDELTQSLFLDMFGDPVRNPMRWKVVNFSDVGKLDRGKSKHRPRNAPELLGGIHPLIQTGNLANCGVYLKEYTSTYSDIGLAQSKKWPSGTLCITIAANIAKTGILTFDACFPDSVVGFIPNQKTNNLYTLFWLSFLQKILEETAPESAQKNINLGILRALDFPLPPIELQNQFADSVQAIEAQKAQAQDSLAQAEDLFNSLLQRAFKGELS